MTDPHNDFSQRLDCDWNRPIKETKACFPSFPLPWYNFLDAFREGAALRRGNDFYRRMRDSRAFNGNTIADLEPSRTDPFNLFPYWRIARTIIGRVFGFHLRARGESTRAVEEGNRNTQPVWSRRINRIPPCPSGANAKTDELPPAFTAFTETVRGSSSLGDPRPIYENRLTISRQSIRDISPFLLS